MLDILEIKTIIKSLKLLLPINSTVFLFLLTNNIYSVYQSSQSAQLSQQSIQKLECECFSELMYITEAVIYNRSNKEVNTDLNKGLHQHGKYIQSYIHIIYLIPLNIIRHWRLTYDMLYIGPIYCITAILLNSLPQNRVHILMAFQGSLAYQHDITQAFSISF